MQMEMDNRIFRCLSSMRHSNDCAATSLALTVEQPIVEDHDPDPIDYASLEFEVERMRKRLAIWEIFMDYMRDGARRWPEVQRSLTEEDFDKIVSICDGVPLRDLLLDLR